MRGNIAHIVDILQSALNFEAAHTGIEHFFDALRAVHVAHRQLMSGGKYASVGINKVEVQATKLRTASAIGRTTETMLRYVTASAVAHTQCAVHEPFDGNGDRRCDGAQLAQREFACHHNLRIAGALQESGFLRCARVHLGRSMKRDGGDVHLEQRKILGYQRIDSGIIELRHHFLGITQFVVVKNGVERDVNAHTEEVGKVANASNILDTVAGRSTRSEGRSSDIHGIRSTTNGFESSLRIFGRTK